jgi:hypothetical protein
MLPAVNGKSSAAGRLYSAEKCKLGQRHAYVKEIPIASKGSARLGPRLAGEVVKGLIFEEKGAGVARVHRCADERRLTAFRETTTWHSRLEPRVFCMRTIPILDKVPSVRHALPPSPF